MRFALAHNILRVRGSIRGLAELRGLARETLRRRFHVSLRLWLRRNGCEPLPSKDKLIAIVDALWFRTKNHRPAYGCFVILLRPVNSNRAYPAALVLLRGRESKGRWLRTFAILPSSVRTRIIAIVADGFMGLMSLAEERGWHFQWCQVHMLRRMLELRGFRNLPGKHIRRRALQLVRTFMETPDEQEAVACQKELRQLFRNPECPHSIVTRISGVVKRGRFLRTCFAVPELNLPATTNSVERVNAFIRERFTLIRGSNSAKSLKLWIKVVRRQIDTVCCRGYRETLLNRTKFYRKSGS